MNSPVSKYFLIILLLAGMFSCTKSFRISEVDYKQTNQYQVVSPGGVYFIEKNSGGCSSLIDRDGNDWIGFLKTGDNKPFNSSDSDFRGMPNLVHKGDENGVGHPGFDMCSTEMADKNILRVRSYSGGWRYSWNFMEDHSLVSIESTDTTRSYWFLYEGPVAGRFNPKSHYWGNDIDGKRIDKPDYKTGPVSGNWQWVFMGDDNVERTLYLAMVEKDTLTDFFAYMGNDPERGTESEDGMTVFGFGRAPKAKPLLKDNHDFIIGFYEKAIQSKSDYDEFRRFIESRINKYKKK